MQPAGRARRAIPLIATAAVAALVAGLLYLRTPGAVPGASAPAHVPTVSGPYLVSYDFISPRIGWAVLSSGGYSSAPGFRIFQTTDGAAHWHQQFASGTGGDAYVHFFDRQHGYAYAGDLYRTVDGGVHWEAVPVAGSLGFAVFESPDLGWALRIDEDSTHLYKTEDAGRTWTKLPADLPASARMLPFQEQPWTTFRGDEGWLGAEFVDAPVVYRTDDGGLTWRTLIISMPGRDSAGFQTSVRLIPGGGVAVTVRDFTSLVVGTMLSLDRGNSWRSIVFPFTSISADMISFVDATHWWLLRYGRMYKTADAGTKWTPVSMSGVPEGWRFESAGAIDAQHGWLAMVAMASSNERALALTSDGGSTWRISEVAHPPGSPS